MRAPLLAPALLLLLSCRPPEAALRRGRIEAAQRRVADWTLAHRRELPGGRLKDTEWTLAVWYAGLQALHQQTQDPRHLAPLLALERTTSWKVGRRPYFGDDQAIAQVYLDLHRTVKPDPALLADLHRVVDAQLALPDPGLGPHTATRYEQGAWTWCDCIFMAPPAWARLAAATGERRYLDAMDAKFWRTCDFLYDQEERLFYRDASYFGKRELNGRKVFWSRGNGWVMGGLARILEVMPRDYPTRPRYEALFREMAVRVTALQQPDGLWRPSLLDPASFPGGETSGTALFTYALAWGIREGLLAREAFLPAVEKAWTALEAAVQPDGRLGWAQPIGKDPRTVKAEDTEVYAAGAFLLAGREMHRLQAEAPMRTGWACLNVRRSVSIPPHMTSRPTTLPCAPRPITGGASPWPS